MNKDKEYLVQIINLYKNGKITRYSVEQELTLFVGSNSEVKIHDEKRSSTGTTFGIFPLPEVTSSGMKLFYYIDEIAIMNLYTPYELVERLEAIAIEKTALMRSVWSFVNEHRNGAVTRSSAIGCILAVYQSIIHILEVHGKDFIPDEAKIATYVVKAQDGLFENSDLETLMVENIFPAEVLNTIEKMIHDSPFDEKDGFVTANTVGNIPSENLWKQNVRPFCDGTYDKPHKDIPWNYTPTTNQ